MKPHVQTMLDEIAQGKAQLFDVREHDEWDAGHLKISHLVPLSDLRVMEEPSSEFPRNIKTYLHCRSGQRVLSAAPILEDMGFEEVIPLEEGFGELVSLGLEPAE